MRLFSLLVVPTAIAVGLAWYLGRPDPALGGPLVLIESSPGVEDLLLKYKDVIGEDYLGYRGHIYRVLTYTMHFLEGDDTHKNAIEAAIVYHDIGLWTDAKLAYLEPSVARAREDLSSEFSEADLQMIENMIMFHHKVLPFAGSPVVEAVRKADWIDATMGLVSQGMPRAHVRAAMAAIPEAGFHATLAGFAPKLHGWNVWKYFDILNIVRW